MKKLEGRVALITGAAGGLGSSLAERFAQEECHLFLTDVNEPKLLQIIGNLRAEGAKVRGAPADLQRYEESKGVVEQAIKEYGHLDVLVNNAGISSTRSIWELTETDWDQMFATNVKGLFFTLQSAARHMVGKGGGSIINITSVAGRVPRPTILHYAASKAAVISITQSAALALATYQVRVNSIAPGMIDTEMLRSLQTMSGNAEKNAHSLSPERVPLGWIAKPEDIGGTAVYLACQDSEHVTGQTLNVCGGLVMS